MSNLPVPPAERPTHSVDHLLRVVIDELTRAHPGHVYSSSMLPPGRDHVAELLRVLGFVPLDAGGEVALKHEWQWRVNSAQIHDAYLRIRAELADMCRGLDGLLSAPCGIDAIRGGADRVQRGLEVLQEPLRVRPDLEHALANLVNVMDGLPADTAAVQARSVLAAARDRIARMIAQIGEHLS